MRKIIATMFLLLVGAAAPAQTAKVVALTPQETKEAAALHKQLDDLQKKILEYDVKLAAKYLITTDTKDAVCPVANGTYLKKGWEKTFIYSEDYKYIVPDPTGIDQCPGAGPLTPFLPDPTPSGAVDPTYKPMNDAVLSYKPKPKSKAANEPIWPFPPPPPMKKGQYREN